MDVPVPTPGKSPEAQELTLALNFVPTWARQDPGVNPYAHFQGRAERSDRLERSHDRRRPGGREAPRAAPAPGPGDGRRPPPRPLHERPRPERRPYPPTASHAAAEESAPVEIAFVPERERLAALVHDLHVARRAFPLTDLAIKFLSNLDCYLVKVEMRRVYPERPGEARSEKPISHLVQCAGCKALFLDLQAAEAHAVARHLDTIFLVEDIVTEPPAGNFICVARCRMSGELLGPPNYHGYNARLLELHRTRFAHLALDDYRSRIEILRDPALVEKWKEEQRKQTVFKLRGADPAPAINRAEAERHFREQALPGMIHRGQRFVVPARGTAQWEDTRLREAIHEAWARESRFPGSLIYALRPAFRHMHLHLFKVSGGVTFVTANHPHPLTAEHVIEPIREVLNFLRAHPGCTRQQLVEGLRPGAAPDAPDVAAVISPMRWLIENGHVIEFFNGTLSLPMAGGGVPGAPRRVSTEPAWIAGDRPPEKSLVNGLRPPGASRQRPLPRHLRPQPVG